MLIPNLIKPRKGEMIIENRYIQKQKPWKGDIIGCYKLPIINREASRLRIKNIEMYKKWTSERFNLISEANKNINPTPAGLHFAGCSRVFVWPRWGQVKKNAFRF